MFKQLWEKGRTMFMRTQGTLTLNLTDGGQMDEATRARIEAFEEDLKSLDEQIKQTEAAKEVHAAHRQYFGNKVGALEFERWVIETNIERLKRGEPEIPWPYDQTEPSDVVDYSRDN